MRRRRFLSLGPGLVLVAAGCAGREGEQRAGEESDSPPSHTRRPEERPANPGDRADGSADESADERADDRGDAEDSGADDAGEPSGADEGDAAADVDPDDYPTTAEEWGERVTGVRSRLSGDDPVVALTFDACGGPGGNGYDEALVDFLVAEEVPATLFVNKRWIEANEGEFLMLAEQPQFRIANHGTAHVPLSVEGRSAYGIEGTGSPAEVIDEVMANQAVIEELTGQAPAHFRPGTAYADEVAVRITGDLGLEVVGYDVLGDAGATYSSGQVREALEGAEAGSIALLHMNHPGSGTARGVAEAVPRLRERGLSFVTL